MKVPQPSSTTLNVKVSLSVPLFKQEALVTLRFEITGAVLSIEKSISPASLFVEELVASSST